MVEIIIKEHTCIQFNNIRKVYWKERRGAHLDITNVVPLKLRKTKNLRLLIKKVKEK